MTRMFVPQRIPAGARRRLEQLGEVHVFEPEDRRISRQELLDGAREAEVLFALGQIPFDRDVIAALRALPGIHRDVLVATHVAGLPYTETASLLGVKRGTVMSRVFRARQALDTNEDGEVSDAELEAGRVASCTALADDLGLAVDGRGVNPTLIAAGPELQPGAGGL